MFKAIRTIKKIKQLQKEMQAFSLTFLTMQELGLVPETEKGKAKAQTMHDISHMIKDILDGKSVDEAMKRLDIVVEADVD
ncbi:glutamate--tRNA ligase [Streptococcus pseudopneumoniae]|uniref:glutamate--tRNA ligase n=1 Tax=Streptococcus pseudopneumoniae TaxID=257758 RepID=UPI00066B493A|nr:glutamate--tRNA ligase [Streptococcus pseudopneumoniae]